MPFPLIPLAIAGVQAYTAGRKAKKQRDKARNLKDSNYVPPALQEALANEKMRADSSSPEYQRGLEKLNQSTATTISQAKKVGGTSAQVQQAVADSDARAKEGIKDLQVADASFKADSRRNVTSLLLNKGEYQARSREQLENAQAALRGAAESNQEVAISKGLQGAAIVGDWAQDKWGKKDPADIKGLAGSYVGGGGTFNANSRGQGLGALSSRPGSFNSNARPYGGGTRLSSQGGRFNTTARQSSSYRRGRGLPSIGQYGGYDEDLMSRGYGYSR